MSSDQELKDVAASVPRNRCPVCSCPTNRRMRGFKRVPLVQCIFCELVFVPLMPSAELLRDHYSRYSRDKSYNSPVSVARRAELLDDFEAFKHKNTILDVGCGTGLLLDEAKARGWQTCGIEFADDAIRLCESYGHQMTQGPLDARNYDQETFDVIVYTEVIEHIANQPQEFDAVFRLLRPGGLLYITTPNFDSLCRYTLGDRWNVISYPEHLVYFTVSTLRFCLERAGFETLAVSTTGLSLSRLFQSMTAKPRGATAKSQSADEKTRATLEANLATRGFKRVANTVLNLSRKGDALKGWFQKPKVSV